MVPIYAEDMNSTDTNETFTDLNNHINSFAESTIQLNGNYTYNSSSDESLIDGVVISRNVTVIGSDTTIDGNHLARGLTIKSNCNVVLENLTFKNGFSENRGGAILLNSNSNLTIINCIFESNTVFNSNGGALCAHSGTNIEIHNSQFINNTSIRESDLEWEKFKRGMGSAICMGINSNLKLYDTVFKKNNAYLSTILVISYDDVKYKLSTLYVDNCSFENNTSKRSGVIYLDELGKGEILNSLFKNNQMIETSGTLILDASIYALVKNCIFESNNAIRGGAINVKKFNENVSNVFIMDCQFIKNYASVSGGAIYSNSGNINIENTTFIKNIAQKHGGAIYATNGSISITDCLFNKNIADYGGAISAKIDECHFENTVFIENSAFEKGGAVYSKIENVYADDCEYIRNTAARGSNVYGAFDAQIKTLSSYFGGVELEIKLSSPWKMPLLQKIKLKFTGKKTYRTKWLKTDNKGFLKIKVPLNLQVGTYTVTITIENGFCYSYKTMTVKKTSCKVYAKRLSATFKSGKPLKIHVKNKKTKKGVANAKITLKIGKGNPFTLKSDRKGLVKYSTYKLSAGKHYVKIYSKDRNIKLSKSKTVINIKRASAKVTYQKTGKKHKLKVTVKNKASGKPIRKTKFDVKIDKGTKSKSIKAKTNKNGEFHLKLKKGKHKLVVKLKNRNYNIYKRFYVRQC